MYSMDLSWAAIVSHEEHALVGGSKDFISHVDQIYPAWRNEVTELIDDWEKEVAIERSPWGVDLFIELLEYWKRYPADGWAETLTAKLNHKRAGGPLMSKIEPIENPDRRNEIREIGRRVF